MEMKGTYFPAIIYVTWLSILVGKHETSAFVKSMLIGSLLQVQRNATESRLLLNIRLNIERYIFIQHSYQIEITIASCNDNYVVLSYKQPSPKLQMSYS